MNNEIDTFKLGFSVYGVAIGVETDSKWFYNRVQTELKRIFPVEIKESEFQDGVHFYKVEKFGDSGLKVDSIDDEIFESEDPDNSFQFFVRNVRTIVAGKTTSMVVVHAGVVAIDGKAIIMPAKSNWGKSTLVAELIKAGAEYYSDDWAVIDADGFVHPFPKVISLRPFKDDFVQVDFEIEDFSSKIGFGPLPISVVIFTRFEEGGNWQPVEVTVAQAMMEILPHTIPIRNNPEFSLSVLNKILKRAILLKSNRGDASQIIRELNKYLI